MDKNGNLLCIKISKLLSNSNKNNFRCNKKISLIDLLLFQHRLLLKKVFKSEKCISVFYITETDAIKDTNPFSQNKPLVHGNTYYSIEIGTNRCSSLPSLFIIDAYFANNI